MRVNDPEAMAELRSCIRGTKAGGSWPRTFRHCHKPVVSRDLRGDSAILPICVIDPANPADPQHATEVLVGTRVMQSAAAT